MSITQVGATVTASNTGAGVSVTSPTLNTTGATLLIITVGNGVVAGSLTVSDSNSNTWHARQDAASGTTHAVMFYAFDKAGAALVVGAGHTVTVAGATSPSITFSAFAGTLANHIDPYDLNAGESGAATGTGTTVQPGSITALNGSLVVTAFCDGGTTGASISVSSPYTLSGSVTASVGVHFGVGIAYATNVTTTNPTWTVGASGSQAATIASFLAAAPTTAGITFDNATDGGNNGGLTNSLTFAHTIITANSPCLIVTFLGDLVGGNDDITGVTYNGVPLTFVAKQTSNSGTGPRIFYVYLLANAPGSITANVVINCTNNHNLLAVAASYAGCATTGQPGNFQVSSGSSTNPTTTSLATPSDQCWMILCDGGASVSAGAGSTFRVKGTKFNLPYLFDSNGAITPPAVYSMTTTSTNLAGAGDLHIMLTLVPAATIQTAQSSLVLNPSNNLQTPQVGPGITQQAILLSQGISSPQLLSVIVYEALQNLQVQLNSVFQFLGMPNTLQTISVASADISNLNVGGPTGPGQLNVFGGPPQFPQIGYIGTAPLSSWPAVPITNITAGLVTTSTTHSLGVNQTVLIAGTSNSADNGYFIVTSVPSATTFTAQGVSGSSSGGSAQRQFAGGWLKSLAVGGSSAYDAIANFNGAWIDETGTPFFPGQYVIHPQLIFGPNGVLQIDNIIWTNNSPGAGSIAWAGGAGGAGGTHGGGGLYGNRLQVSYQGVLYPVTAGNTSNTFIYWQLSNPTVFQTTSTYPALGADDFIIAINNTNNTGTFGIYTSVMDVHNSNNDRTLLYAGSLVIYDSSAHQIVSASRSIAANPAGLITLGYQTTPNIVSMNASGGAGTLTLINNVDSGQVFLQAAPGGSVLELLTPAFAVGLGITATGGGGTSATAGTHGAVPAQVAGYYTVTVNGASQKIPYFNP